MLFYFSSAKFNCQTPSFPKLLQFILLNLHIHFIAYIYISMCLHSIHTALSYPTRGHQDLELNDTNKPNPKLGTGVGRSIGRKGKRGKVKEGKIRMNRTWTPTLINIEYPLDTLVVVSMFSVLVLHPCVTHWSKPEGPGPVYLIPYCLQSQWALSVPRILSSFLPQGLFTYSFLYLELLFTLLILLHPTAFHSNIIS